MKTVSFKEFVAALSKAYAVDINPDDSMDGDLWRVCGKRTRLCFNWMSLPKIQWLGNETMQGVNIDEVKTLSIHNGPFDIRLLHRAEDEIKYDEENDVYYMTDNYEEHVDSGEKDDDGYTIYNKTGVWKKKPVKLVMLYRKSA